VVGNVARGVVLLAALWVFSGYRPRWHFAIEETKRFARFGLQVAGSNLLFHVYKNADYFLVGKLLGVEALGLYRVAFDVAMQPTDTIIAVVGRVGFPVYAKLSHDLAALRATFASNTRSLFLMVAPLAALIFFCAHELFEVVGEGRWLGGVPAVQILVWAGLLRAATTMFPQVYVAMGKPAYATVDSLLTVVVLTTSFWVGLRFFPELGVMSVCYAWLLVYPLFLIGHLEVARRLIALEAAPYLRAFAAGLGPALPMTVGLWAWRRVSHGLGLGVLELASFILLGLAIYWGYLRWVLGVRFGEILPKRSRGGAPAPSE
jgi:O-antigen/teichoic acid export membrane protein